MEESVRRRQAVGVVGICLLVVSVPVSVLAHHAFSAEFDAESPVKFVSATVTKVEWINPHTWIHIEVNGEEWAIEAGTPNVLFRRGVSSASLKPGAVIVVEGYRAKDGSHRANGRDLTLPNGQTLFLGSTGTGAPSDGKDPAERK
jgi:Family of unknown function (DUF6152)